MNRFASFYRSSSRALSAIFYLLGAGTCAALMRGALAVESSRVSSDVNAPQLQVGAAATRAGEPGQYWAFQPVRAEPPPQPTDGGWVKNDVDRYILAALEAKGLKPSPPADKRTLLRRATFDLIGLPPTPEEIDAFAKDTAPDAFSKVIERLLASPHYGERWGRHWLDTIRFADGSGRVCDFPEIWKYRDWVTESFNRDFPFDKFIMYQFAGDLMQPEDKNLINKDALIATGLLAIAQFDPGNVDPRAMNADYVDDEMDVVGRAVLGLTISCARCHDHKFDPITSEDYYALAGFFFNTRVISSLTPDPNRLRAPLLPRADVDRINAMTASRNQRIAELEQEIKKRSEPGKSPATQPPTAPSSPVMMTTAEELASLKEDLERVKKEPVPEIPQAVVVQEGGQADGDFATFKDAPVYARGDPHRPGKLVPRGFPRALAGDHQPAITHGSGRLELARWLASPDNPLPARVMANRIWQHHFGEGIVRTPNNFGKMGQPPSNPELLDFLARRFIDSGWSMKTVHRLVMLSATYQQSDTAPAETLAVDPENRYFGRMNRRRLDAEALRDSLLLVSGRLDLTVGGMGYRDLNTPRRTHYLMTVRSETTPSGFGLVFDRPDPSLISERRAVSTAAPQALFMLNDAFVVAQAKSLAERINREVPGNDNAARIRRLYAVALGREPAAEEMDIGLKLLADSGQFNSLERYCQVILCTNEFANVD